MLTCSVLRASHSCCALRQRIAEYSNANANLCTGMHVAMIPQTCVGHVTTAMHPALHLGFQQEGMSCLLYLL